ncbi:hypothetical protein ACJX0J_012644, partial [Zea mays]
MVITDTAKERHKTNSNGMAIWQYGIERHKAALDINYFMLLMNKCDCTSFSKSFQPFFGVLMEVTSLTINIF